MFDVFTPPKRLSVPAADRQSGFVIRAWERDDVELKRQTCLSYEHLRPWMPWVRESETPEESKQILRALIERYERNLDFALAIVSEDGRTLLGGTGLHLREGPLDTLCAEVGLWIAEDRAGYGLGTRALRAMLAWGLSEWPFLRLSWRCDSRNEASRRVAEKVGMLYEGTLRGQKAEVGDGRRDTLCFAALKGEWSVSGSPPLPAP